MSQGPLRIRPAPRRIRLGSLVGGLFLVFGTAVGFLVAWEHVGGGSVVVVTRDVAAGHVLQADDLGIASVRGTGDVPFIPASDRDREIGRPAAVDLVAGQPLVQADVGQAPSSLSDGQAVVAIALQAGQFPPGLAAGDGVLVVDTGGATPGLGAQQATPPSPVRATVLKVDDSSTSFQGTQRQTVVSLRVPSDSVLDVARAAAASRASIALLPPGS